MWISTLNILNYRNIREASLEFAPKLNCFVGLNGQGKTNVLDAIYLLSFAKSAFTSQDSLNITHGEEMAFVQGIYRSPEQLKVESLKLKEDAPLVISCGLRKGVKKQFRRDKKDYPRLIDHIGLIPLVMISPSDQQLIDEGSDERRRFMDVVISQQDRKYLDCLTKYNALLKQRNALLKQYADAPAPPDDLLEVLEWQMVEPAEYIFEARTKFFSDYTGFFERVYNQISRQPSAVSYQAETPHLRYVSQLQDRDLRDSYVKTRQRDLILGWTSQGIHKDELEMKLGEWPLKQVGSQGQQRTFVLAMKLAQALYLADMTGEAPILLLDDIFDRLDSERVERIVTMVQSEQFGQIFITDTDRQHLTDIIQPGPDAKIFHVEGGEIEN